jgi:hypothetical protein
MLFIGLIHLTDFRIRESFNGRLNHERTSPGIRSGADIAIMPVSLAFLSNGRLGDPFQATVRFTGSGFNRSWQAPLSINHSLPS